jgi:hypothetical protein
MHEGTIKECLLTPLQTATLKAVNIATTTKRLLMLAMFLITES